MKTKKGRQPKLPKIKRSKAHAEWLKAGSPTGVRCFNCGKGTIVTTPVGIYGWITECTECGFIYDED